jgi:hypothetical protein
VRCPLCDSTATETFLERRAVPIHQNVLVRGEAAARAVPRGDLTLAVCARCGFIFNRTFDPAKLSYGESYESSQGSSPAVQAYVAELVERIKADLRGRASTAVEVGCGQGGFLRALVAAAGPGATGRGFDPSYTGPLEDLDGRLHFERRDFGPDCARVPPDVVIGRHVIEHVADPRGLLGTVRRSIGHPLRARLFLETPCVEWILRKRVIWDFFYEHCSLFTPASLRLALESEGFAVERAEHVFSGQYLWVASRASAPVEPRADPGEIVDLARAFGASEPSITAEWRERLATLAKRGRVAVWGAGAKGVTFANRADPKVELVDCLVDLNPRKQGCHVPGTGHPIVDYRDLPGRGVLYAVLMNPNYRQESQAFLASAGIDVELVEWPGR